MQSNDDCSLRIVRRLYCAAYLSLEVVSSSFFAVLQGKMLITNSGAELLP